MRLWPRKHREADLDRELRTHLDLEAQDHRDRGLSPDDARLAALRAFGNVSLTKEDVRSAWGWTLLEQFAADARYAFRGMWRSPALTAIAVLSLALGIGANTAIFSLVDAVLLRMLPIERPAELERIGMRDGPNNADVFSYPLFRELRARNQVFAGMFARNATPASLVAAGRTERGVMEIASGGYFTILGVHPLMGRLFTDEDDRTPSSSPVAVISFQYWRERLSADPAVLGKTIRINNYPFTVIGVTPPGFFGIEVGTSPDVWVPMMMQPEVFGGRVAFDDGNWGWLQVFGRRAPGLTEQQARAGLDVTLQQIQLQNAAPRFYAHPKELSIRLTAAAQGTSRLRVDFENPLEVLMALVGLVLLIACANVANLLLARSAARRREIAVRLSLGAARSRLIRQLLTESILLSLIGGALGVLFSGFGVHFLLAFLPADRIPIVLEVSASARVLGFALAVSVLTGALFGLAPALESTRATLAGSLKDDGARLRGRGRFGLRRLLVVAQVSLSLLLLVGAGLFLRSLRNTAAINIGLKTDGVLMASVNPRLNGYTPPQVANFYQQLQARLSAMPEVQAVGMSEVPLLSGNYNAVGLRIAGLPDPPQGRSIITNTVDPGLFDIAGIPIVRGRGFGPQDTPASGRVVILSETAARYFFGDAEPIGRKVVMGSRAELEVIGIARDSKYRAVREDTPRIGYYDLAQVNPPVVERTVYLRTVGDPTAHAAALRAAIRGLDRNLPVYNLKTFDQQKAESLVRERMIATLSGFFGALALLLAAVGIYGVMAYAVLHRTREIGIRMSLGAARRKVIWMVLRDALATTAAGIVIGFPLARWLAGFVATQLYGVKPTDAGTLFTACAVLAGVALLAAAIPAWKASRVDPVIALRWE